MAELVAARAALQAPRTEAARRAPSGRARDGGALELGHLQRAVGNLGMHRLLRAGVVQAKLTVGPADDDYEREADRVADQVMRMPDPTVGRALHHNSVQASPAIAQRVAQLHHRASAGTQRTPVQINRKCDECEKEELHQATETQGPAPEEDETVVQAKGDACLASEAPSDVESYVAGSRGSGQPLGPSVRAFFEPRFGRDLGHVRVHTDSRADHASREISARAFTAGSNLYFAQGQYEPGSYEGKRLLGHELTHVFQQGAVSGAYRAGEQRAQGAAARTGDISIQRVADKSDVPAMACTADLTPGIVAGTNIMFGSADKNLDAGDKTQIAADHATWLAAGGIDTLNIHGFASSEDTAANNWKLSCDRAEAVKAEFVRLGVPDTMVPTIAHGETEEFSATSRAANRRAVVQKVGGTAPTVIIFPVSFATTINRVPPGITVPVLVVAVGVPAGRTIDLDILGSGGVNGTAAVAPATIAGSAIVNVTGAVQTTPGNAGNLTVRARMGGLTVGSSPGFTVAAHPTNFSVTLNADLNTATQVGLLANNAWTSDGTGGVAELDQIQRGEAIAQGHQDRPPYFSGLGAPSGKSPGNVSPRVDTHSEPRASIRPTVAMIALGGTFTDVVNQLFIFDDARTGLLNQTAVNSGFTITSSLTFNAGRGGWDEQTVKTGAATTVGGQSTAAGAGTATSLVHPI